jgi:UDP-N-acetylmuramyl pentapeptide synthase
LAKSEIMNHIKKDGVVFLNKEDDYFGDLKKRAKIKKLQIVTFAKSKIADVQLLKTVKKNRKNYLIVKVFKNQFRIETKTFNDNFVVNYLITLSVFSYLGLDLKKIIKNAKNFPTPSGRGDLVVKIIDGKKVKIINESYNANPISMKNAIENFSSLAQSGKKKVAIIGDMLELGLKSKHYHEQIAELLINSRIDHVHLIGKEVAYIYQKLKKFKKCNIYNNINHFGEVFSKIANDKSIFLIKGSNGIGLSKLLNDKL